MNSLLFAAMLVAITWLCVWSVLPRPWTRGGWWPFDMRADAPAEPPAAAQAGQPARRGERADARAAR
jgi:hypothetical protein